MDLSSYPPAPTEPPAAAAEIPAEAPAYMAQAANPTPPLVSNNNNHPPYAEMITAAIAALKDKNGSSRQAIAKYIERVYPNLPANHSALLTRHLKRLKSVGQLAMVKHSYTLPRSVLPPAPLSPSATIPGGANDVSFSGPKRGPGRPPKPKGDALEPNCVGLGPEAVLVSLGLSDAPIPEAKRGPGRPPKAKTGFVLVAESGSSIPLGGFSGKRGRGRPPMLKSVGQSGLKRKAGRPPRSRPIGPAGVPRSRGRPKKDGLVRKAPGRPRKSVVASVDAGGGGSGGALVGVGGGVSAGKRRGRPPRAGGIKKPRKLTGSPLGRPRKNTSITGIQAAATQQSVKYEDLKNKLQHFQSRIKQAVSMVKPHINNETAVSAFGALQELEELATTDLTA